MKNTLIYMTIAILLFSCTDDDPVTDCALIIPEPNNVLLLIKDADGVPLIGTQFVQDSFRLRGNNKVTYLQRANIGNGEHLNLFYSQIDSGISFYLDLSETETDTIRLNYTTVVNECAVSNTLDSVLYNGSVPESIEENLITVLID